jgi:predicted dithiol-disulfide oxidoreductase (DUF899 family)
LNSPNIVSRAEWQAARDDLLLREQEATRVRAELAAERRRLPMVRIDKAYEFEGPDGKVSLLDLFDGRRQLIVYRFFFQPGVADFPKGGCSGCSMFVDGLSHLAHLHARDTSLVLISPAPQADIERFKARMGWDFPWFTTHDDVSEDFGVTEWFGLNVFIHDDENVFHTYFTTGSPVQALGNVWSLLDITPLGRQEEGEDSPEGYPQTPPHEWYRLHDEYDEK